ncbi:ABC transporter substrate-binding protein [Nocardiopsis changdeensis]|uniref:ABC transporter substrate-binding protein n=1 Tax=Nocardiopsis changdeensis TaxID=2831969 RepID=A0ABX8BFN7_9ACTN|nr:MULTISPECIES: ABC transporter substrate-binding protein [Nocardiopsis]QUX21050.1 ABC transporter substrate-binding protein [Nocardiopsis changdeensis]QYX36980.1 ABC transporter substrate-binding protein [Nocardiopsis sp. MT53]
MSKRTTVLSAAAAALALSLAATACGGAEDGGGSGDGAPADSLTLGYFPNLTHAPALVGVENGTLAEALGDVELQTQTFNAGPDAINALFAGEIDATFIGPNPAINGWSQSDGTALRIIAGSTSRGAGLVVREGIDSVEDLPGTTLSTPQLGNTQDVALRWFVREQGWEVDTEGGGDLSILPQDNAEIIDTFLLGEIDGAWVPEPHLSRLVEEGGGHLLVDEADLWPETGGEFVTTHLIVNADFLEANPEVVEGLLRGHVETVDWINDNPEEARAAAIAHLESLTGGELDAEVVASAFGNMTFTVDPVAESLRGGAEHAEGVGLLDPVDLEGIYALDLLNGVLTGLDREEVAGF